jgi:hypothetical protein
MSYLSPYPDSKLHQCVSHLRRVVCDQKIGAMQFSCMQLPCLWADQHAIGSAFGICPLYNRGVDSVGSGWQPPSDNECGSSKRCGGECAGWRQSRLQRQPYSRPRYSRCHCTRRTCRGSNRWASPPSASLLVLPTAFLFSHIQTLVSPALFELLRLLGGMSSPSYRACCFE